MIDQNPPSLAVVECLKKSLLIGDGFGGTKNLQYLFAVCRVVVCFDVGEEHLPVLAHRDCVDRYLVATTHLGDDVAENFSTPQSEVVVVALASKRRGRTFDYYRANTTLARREGFYHIDESPMSADVISVTPARPRLVVFVED